MGRTKRLAPTTMQPTRHPPAFGELLRQFRTARGWTQEELAERAMVSPRAIINCENGATLRPQRETVRLLAEALGLSPDDRALLAAAVDAQRAQQPPPAPSAPSTPTAPATMPVLPEPPAHLPAPLAPLLAREDELASLTTALARDDVRLLTVVGPGGVGKTRLALAAAAAVGAAYADGVYFVSLAPVRDPEVLWPAVAQTLGVTPAGAQTSHDALRSWLRGRQVLLVLDNFEHLLSEAVTVTNLLMACARVTVLVTSRAPLRLRGEHEFPLAPLAMPDDWREAGAAVAESPAVQVFAHYARAVRPTFRVTAENSTAVAAICAHLDGLPLALELAAARMRHLTAAQVLGRLTPRLSALVDGPQDLSPRQRTMRDAIAWSDGLLAEPERRVFARFAVFAGGATPDAVAAVCGEGAEECADSLVLQNLLTVTPDAGDAPRYNMLETVREYASERARQSGEAEEAQRQHAAYFLAFAQEARPRLGERGPWRERVTMELDNLRAALRWARDTGDATMSLRFTRAMAPFWRDRGYLREGMEWARAAIELGASAGPETASLRADALVVAGNLLYQLADYPQAAALLHEGLALARAGGDERTTAEALGLLGVLAMESGELAQSRPYLEESLALLRRLDRPSAVSRTLHRLSNEAFFRGDYARAIQLAEESLAIATALEEEANMATEQSMLARTYNAMGDAAHALDYARAAVMWERRAGHRAQLPSGLFIYADVLRALHRDAEAIALYEEGIEISRDTGEARSEFWGVMGRAEAFSALGDYAGAAASFARGLAVAGRLASKQPYAPGLEGVALLAHAVGQHEEAATLLSAAHTLQRTLDAPQRPEGRAVTEAARHALGEAGFTGAWEAGEAMPLDDAVARAKLFLETVRRTSTIVTLHAPSATVE